MKFYQSVLSISVASTIVVMSGCGVTSQDQGVGDGGHNVSGVAVDGYVRKALVYVDTNENNKLDIWETHAITDNGGYFTYRPAYTDKNGDAIAAVNYCELDVAHLGYQHCLLMPAGYSEVLIRMTKGYDVTTNENFTGTLSMRVSTNSAQNTPMIATPISSLLAHMDADQKANFFALETDVDAMNATLDFLNFSITDASAPASNEERRTLMALGLKVHKAADIIAGILDAELDQGLLSGQAAKGGFFGKASGMPSDASVYVYAALANALSTVDSVAPTNSLSVILGDNGLLSAVITKAWANISSVISAYNATVDPGDTYDYAGRVGFDGTDPDFDSIAAQVVLFSDMIDGVLVDGEDVSSIDNLKARMRAIDIVAAMMRNKEESYVIKRSRELALDSNYVNNLKASWVDVGGTKARFIAKAGNGGSIDSLSEVDAKTVKDAIDALDAGVADFEGRPTITDLFGSAGFTSIGDTDSGGLDAKQLKIGNADEGQNVSIAFTGDEVGADGEPATTGTMQIDASFLGDAGEGDTELVLEGTWEQIDEYTMVMNVEIAGSIQPIIIKPTLTDKIDPDTGKPVIDPDTGKPVQVTAYYFDLGGEQQLWTP